MIDPAPSLLSLAPKARRQLLAAMRESYLTTSRVEEREERREDEHRRRVQLEHEHGGNAMAVAAAWKTHVELQRAVRDLRKLTEAHLDQQQRNELEAAAHEAVQTSEALRYFMQRMGIAKNTGNRALMDARADIARAAKGLPTRADERREAVAQWWRQATGSEVAVEDHGSWLQGEALDLMSQAKARGELAVVRETLEVLARLKGLLP